MVLESVKATSLRSFNPEKVSRPRAVSRSSFSSNPYRTAEEKTCTLPSNSLIVSGVLLSGTACLQTSDGAQQKLLNRV
jgi:hypothetical protein